MADDKGASTGGSSAWTAAEVIIVIILVLALLSKLFGAPKTPVTSVPDVAGGNAPIVTQTKNQCALFITRPLPLEKVRNFVTINGSATNCSWSTQYPAAVYVQIVDTNGIALSDLRSLAPTRTDPTTATFSISINLTGVPATSIGYAQITITDASAQNHQTTARIPITFTN
jgi:hypothetical protein